MKKISLSSIVLQSMVLLLLTGLFSWPVLADEPKTDQFKQSVLQVVEILKDTSLASLNRREERRDKLRHIIYAQFDFDTMSQGAVGHKWQSFTVEQKDRFTLLFRALLEDSYLDKIEGYQGEGVEFIKDAQESAKIFRVDSLIRHKNQEYRVSYRLINRNDRLAVFDIVIEGVSLINNYRAQFQQILSNSTVDDMIDKLEKKVGGRHL